MIVKLLDEVNTTTFDKLYYGDSFVFKDQPGRLFMKVNCDLIDGCVCLRSGDLYKEVEGDKKVTEILGKFIQEG